MAGLLKKKGETYRNSRLGATALNAHHPAYRGDYLRLITSHWADWGTPAGIGEERTAARSR